MLVLVWVALTELVISAAEGCPSDWTDGAPQPVNNSGSASAQIASFNA